MRARERRLLIVEILVCFLPITLILLMGALLLPMQVMFLWQDWLLWEGPGLVLLAVPCGVIGLCSLFFVVSSLFAGREKFDNPVPVLGGVLLGAAPLLLQAVLAIAFRDETEWRALAITTLLPLLATTHVLYLSRRLFLEGFRSGKRPLVSRRTWVVTALIAGLAVFLIDLWHGLDYAELETRRAYWLEHKPAHYAYDFSIRGFVRQRHTTLPEQGPWPVDEVFEALLTEKKQGARVNARFDRSTGAVLSARVDNEDSEASWGIELRNFRPVASDSEQIAPAGAKFR